MTDYTDQGLDPFLQPNDTPKVDDRTVSSMDFDVLNDRNIIGATKLKNFSFSQGEGGTIILGGVNDGNGQLIIKDSSGNIIVSGDNLGFHGYLTSGTESIRISGAGIQGYGIDGNTFAFYDQFGGTQAGQLGYLDAQSALYLATTNGKSIFIDSDFEIQATALDDILIQAQGINQIQSVTSDINVIANSNVNVTYGGNFKLNGTTKTAIMQTSKGYNALYTNESPEVWFMDFVGNDKKLDPMFEEVTEGESKFIKVEGDGYQVWRKRRGMSRLRFESKTKEEYEANNRFWSQNKPN